MLNGAVIGCGRMGAEPSCRLEGRIASGWLPVSHVEAMIHTGLVRPVALADVDSERLTCAGRLFGIERVFEDYQVMLRDVKPDIVTIATRTPEKAGAMRAAMRAGVKGIYVEKPIANSIGVAVELLGEAVRQNVHVSYGVNRRFHTMFRQARDVIASRELGDVREVLIEFGQSKLLWTHPHSVDLMIFLLGRVPLAVQAELVSSSVVSVSSLKIDSDPVVAHAQFWFEGGARGIILEGEGYNVRVNCERGSLAVQADGAAMDIRRPASKDSAYHLRHEICYPVATRGATVTALHELAEAVMGNRQGCGISPDEILWGITMLMGCVHSHMAGCIRRELAHIPLDLAVSGRFGTTVA